MQEEKNTQEDSKHTGKFRALSVVLVVAVALFVSSPISAFAEKFPTLPGVGTGSGSDNSWMENNPLLPGNNPGSGADSGTGEDTGNSEENDTADLSKDSSQWVDRDKSGIYDGSINSMIDSDEEEADEPEQDSGMKWFVDVINAILTFIPIQIANALYSLLNMLGASLDNLIYGRLVSDVALFTFRAGKRKCIWNYRKYYIQHSPRNLTVGVYDDIYGECFYQLMETRTCCLG